MFQCESSSICLPQLSVLGAMGLGFVLGWMLYFVNRYRKDVSISDLGTIVAALAGATVLGFIDVGELTKGAMVGAYGVGLFLGFLAYGYVLYRLVKSHPDQYDLVWFIDGRRKLFDESSYEVPSADGTPNRGHSLQRSGSVLESAIEVGDANSLTKMQNVMFASASGPEEYQKAINALKAAISGVARAAAIEPAQAERDRLLARRSELYSQLVYVQGRQIEADLSDNAIVAALVELNAATDTLANEASKLETASRRLEQVAEILTASSKVVTSIDKLTD